MSWESYGDENIRFICLILIFVEFLTKRIGCPEGCFLMVWVSKKTPCWLRPWSSPFLKSTLFDKLWPTSCKWWWKLEYLRKTCPFTPSLWQLSHMPCQEKFKGAIIHTNSKTFLSFITFITSPCGEGCGMINSITHIHAPIAFWKITQATRINNADFLPSKPFSLSPCASSLRSWWIFNQAPWPAYHQKHSNTQAVHVT